MRYARQQGVGGVAVEAAAALTLVDGDTPVRLGEEQRRFVMASAAGPEPAGDAPDLVERFRAHAARGPQRLAVVAPEGSLTYGELDRISDGLARHLRALGVGPDRPVGVALPRGARELCTLLATLKAGGCYVPVDPTHPPERVRLILEDAAPDVLVTLPGAPVAALVGPGTALVAFDEERLRGGWALDLRRTEEEPVHRPEELAYILFTSGSTGRPKGVEISREAFANFLRAMERAPGLGEGDRLLAITTTTFDIAGLELFLPLAVGATVLIADRETACDPRRLRARLESDPPTVLQATPATWRLLLEAGWKGHPGLRMLCGGEALTPELAGTLLATGGELWNVYGPTETTVWSTAERVRSASETITIGRPIDHTRVYVLSPEGQPVPPGEVGELHIGGRGLARGYRNRPDLTAERFWNGGRAGRLYRTGDMGRLLPDGRFQCLGRVDRQVKIRGFRVELGEIEAALRSVPGVREVVVQALPSPDGNPELCAYWVGSAGREALLERSRGRLPAYMVPCHYVPLEVFPLNTNGKIDRQALPRPATRAPAGRPCQQGREATIARLMAGVLGLPEVGTDQDFFALGGTSVKVVALRARLENELGSALPLSLFFEPPATVAALARRLEARQTPGSLVQLHEGGAGTPLFLIHDADGETLPYLNLARRLGHERPVYGLQPLGKGGIPIVHTTIEDMATHYVAEIRKVQAGGPYLLGGLCAGGVIAYEVARQLELGGQRAHLVALIDAADVEAPKRPHLESKRRLERVISAVRGGRLRQAPRLVLAKAWGYASYQLGSRAQLLADRAAVNLLRFCQDRGWPVPARAREVPVRTVYEAAEAVYRPEHVLKEAIVLFRATAGTGADEAFVELYADPLLGWGRRTATTVRAFDVDGGHGSMLEEPQVAAVAAELSRYLTELELGALTAAGAV